MECYNGILYSLKKKGILLVETHMGRTGEHYAK
jgi:hypothetical protein